MRDIAAHGKEPAARRACPPQGPPRPHAAVVGHLPEAPPAAVAKLSWNCRFERYTIEHPFGTQVALRGAGASPDAPRTSSTREALSAPWVSVSWPSQPSWPASLSFARAMSSRCSVRTRGPSTLRLQWTWIWNSSALRGSEPAVRSHVKSARSRRGAGVPVGTSAPVSFRPYPVSSRHVRSVDAVPVCARAAVRIAHISSVFRRSIDLSMAPLRMHNVAVDEYTAAVPSAMLMIYPNIPALEFIRAVFGRKHSRKHLILGRGRPVLMRVFAGNGRVKSLSRVDISS